MARDLKLVQRGVNVQANDLAVPAGTPVRALNIDLQRDGVATRRGGFARFDTGLPWVQLDPLSASGVTDTQYRVVSELFSRDRSMLVHGGFVFNYDESLSRWMSVPVNLPEHFRFFGNDGYLPLTFGVGYGHAIYTADLASGNSPFNYQSCNSSGYFTGCINNTVNQAAIATATTAARFGGLEDCVFVYDAGTGRVRGVVSDTNCIRWADTGAIIAGSLTASGATDGTGAAATFSGVKWMASTFTGAVYVADNNNLIRLVTPATGVVTTLAGSITAGDVDGVGTAARFRTISGLVRDQNGGNFLYVVESGGHRVRKVDVLSGSVTIFAGALTPTSGYTDATGTAARFNGPQGIEQIGTDLYVGDTNNQVVRKITAPGAVVTTYAGVKGATLLDVRGGDITSAPCAFPDIVLRGVYTPYGSSNNFLIVETNTIAPGSATKDTSLVAVSSSSGEKSAYHIARHPGSVGDGLGCMKIGSIGPNPFALLSSPRGIDLGDGCAFLSAQGPMAIDVWNRYATTQAQPRLRALGINTPEAPSTAAVAGTTFAASTSVAYRVVSGLTLPDGRIAIGPPSERITLIGSTTATWSGSLTVFPAVGLPMDGLPFVQVYRTRAAASTGDPGDQMFLCYEADAFYGSPVTLTDQLPDDLLGAELYTNATADGIATTALPPPTFPGDMAMLGDQLVLGNFVPRASVRIKVLGVTSLVAGTSTITLTALGEAPFRAARTITLTAIAGATAPASNQFQIGTGGTAAQNAVTTARNIATCLNRSPDAFLFFAQYDESDPGSVLVTLLLPGVSASSVVARVNTLGNNVTSGAQNGITFSTNAGTSFIETNSNVATREPNHLAYSEAGAYDSFPAVNTAKVSGGSEAILRLLPLSDTMIAVKDDSVWSFDVSFVPRIYDKALSCSLPDSFAMVNNQWFGLFSRGFCALNATQAVALGRPIDRDVTSQYRRYVSTFTRDLAYGAAIDLSGNYLCAFNGRAYAYNVVSQGWSEWAINTLATQSGGDSAIRVVGAFRDSFIACGNGARSVLRQRQWQRDSSVWFKDFADQTYAFSSALLASNLASITVAAYDATANAGTLPPRVWDLPAGAIADDQNAAADFWWVFEITPAGGGSTVLALGTVAVASPESGTSAITINLAQAVAMSAGSVTVNAYPPIVCRVQYAPFAQPGGNAGFGDMLVTAERAQPGWMVSRFFGRKDYGSASVTAVGWFGDSYGVSRAKLMPSLTSSDNGVSAVISFADAVRFATPRERAFDQVLSVELWEGVAWQPLALKVVSVDKRDTDNAKVTQ